MDTRQIDFEQLWHPHPKQALATRTADRHRYTLFGGSRGPGKSYWLRWWLLRFLLNCAAYGLKHVRVGLFCEDYPSLKDRQISKISVEFPQWLGELKESQEHGLGFHLRPEYGSGVLALRNLDDPSKYQSAEFAAIGVEELTKNPVNTFDILRGSLRWPGIINTRFVAATNPGGIGHLWVKDYWIDRVYPKELQGLANEFAFVPALPDDNPSLSASYWDELNSLPPELARAWRYGEWDVFVGQVFSEWRRDLHLIPPRELPANWPRWRSVDWGYANPFCALWLAQDPNTKRVLVYREAYERELTDRQQAGLITTYTPPSERIPLTYADPSMWTKKTHEDRTFSTADEYLAAGVPLTKADNERLIGLRKLHSLLAPSVDGLPGLQIFETCINLIRTLPVLVHDKVNVEDVDSKGEDHAYDALRYGLTNVQPVALVKPKPPQTPDILIGKRGRVKAQGGLNGRDF